MTAPVEITFRSMDPSPAALESIQTWARRLEHSFDELERCAVVVELPHRRHRQGKTFQVRIYLTVAERTIAITRDPGLDPAHEDLHVAIADAFRAARRTLQDHARIRRGDVKLHA
jgi:hypothetical protein